MENERIGKKILHIILAVVIALQVGIVTKYFVFDKEAFHSDEPWTFGLSNSYYHPFIYGNEDPDSYEKDVDISSFGVWIDGEDFNNYLTVQENERFTYDSVWYNQAHDVHPPLHYAILHTICSFFPNVFSSWFAYVINIASMIIGQIFFFKAARIICRSDVLAILACCMWGFSAGFINLNIYLRMYSLLTAIVIIFTYYHARLYYDIGSAKSNLIKIAVFTFLGALTHHYFLVSAFAIAACFCFYYLFKMKFKRLFAYAASVAGAVALSMIVFPAAFSHMFSMSIFYTDAEIQELTAMPFLNGFYFAITVILNAICGFLISPYLVSTYSYFVAVFVILLAASIPLAVLFRNEEWFKKLMAKAVKSIKYFFKNFDFIFLFLLIGVLFTAAIVALVVNINVIQELIDRYLFLVVPWAVLCLVLAVKYILRIFRLSTKYSDAVIGVLVCLSIISSIDGCPIQYAFKRNIMGEGGIETTVSDNSEYVLFNVKPWRMVLYTDKLMGCEKALFTDDDTYHDIKDSITQMNPAEKDCYIVMETFEFRKLNPFNDDTEDDENSVLYVTDGGLDVEVLLEEDVVKEFEEDFFPGYRLQFYSSEDIFGTPIHTYKLVPESEYEEIPVVDYQMEDDLLQ